MSHLQGICCLFSDLVHLVKLVLNILAAGGFKLLFLLGIAELPESHQKTLVLLLKLFHAAEGHQMLADHL